MSGLFTVFLRLLQFHRRWRGWERVSKDNLPGASITLSLVGVLAESAFSDAQFLMLSTN